MQTASHVVPIPERLTGSVNEVECFTPGETNRTVIVRLMAGFLQLHESRCNVDQCFGTG